MERRAPVVCALTLVVCLAGCPAHQAYEEDLSRTRAGLHHAVHSERLARVMRRLDRLTNERLPQAMDVEAARDPLLQEIVEVARAIARSAEAIPVAAEEEGALPGEATAPFRERTRLLRQRALELAERAPQMTRAEQLAATARLRAACESCHADFRFPEDADERDAWQERGGGPEPDAP